jgi:hypothetical protein
VKRNGVKDTAFRIFLHPMLRKMKGEMMEEKRRKGTY